MIVCGRSNIPLPCQIGDIGHAESLKLLNITLEKDMIRWDPHLVKQVAVYISSGFLCSMATRVSNLIFYLGVACSEQALTRCGRRKVDERSHERSDSELSMLVKGLAQFASLADSHFVRRRLCSCHQR